MAVSITPGAIPETSQRELVSPNPLAPARALPVALAFLALAVFPMVGDDYYTGLVAKIMIMAIFALSLELLVGQTGLISFGHAAFFGIGAYTAALITPSDAPASLWLALPLSMAAAALYALPVGALSLRTKGVYFIMITLAFAQMAYYVFHDAPFSGGSDGTYMYFRPEAAIAGWLPFDIEDARSFYNLVLVALVLVFGLLAVMLRSRYGRALAGIRANEQRMRAAGYPTYAYKLGVFVLSAALAGLAGFLYALKDGFVNPELLSWHESGTVLLMIILGGIGHLRGALLGAVAFTLLKELFQSEQILGSYAQHWQLWLGLTIIAFVAFMPRGLIGLIDRGGHR